MEVDKTSRKRAVMMAAYKTSERNKWWAGGEEEKRDFYSRNLLRIISVDRRTRLRRLFII